MKFTCTCFLISTNNSRMEACFNCTVTGLLVCAIITDEPDSNMEANNNLASLRFSLIV